MGEGRQWETEGIWEVSIPAPQFGCESKTALKK